MLRRLTSRTNSREPAKAAMEEPSVKFHTGFSSVAAAMESVILTSTVWAAPGFTACTLYWPSIVVKPSMMKLLPCHASSEPRMAVPSPMHRLPWYNSVLNPSMEAPSLKKTVPSTG